MASLSTCHLELDVWDGNLVKSCYDVLTQTRNDKRRIAIMISMATTTTTITTTPTTTTTMMMTMF